MNCDRKIDDNGEFVWGKPKCVNYPGVDWDDLTLTCTESGALSFRFHSDFPK